MMKDMKDMNNMVNMVNKDVTQTKQESDAGALGISGTPEEGNPVRGYKVFYEDWSCRNGFQYRVGEVFQEDIRPKCTRRGMHFCLKLQDCFAHYSFASRSKVAEVEALGDIDYSQDGSLCSTNKLRVVREIPWNEVLAMVNTGNRNTGIKNTGNRNTGCGNAGHRNTGDRNTGSNNTGNRNTGCSNTGDRNTGDRNTGDWNTGNHNAGRWNTGNYNSGSCNSGSNNTGNWNTGDWNSADYCCGCFNTINEPFRFFNEPSDWTYSDWMASEARSILLSCPSPVGWVLAFMMTEEEKAAHPEYITTGGYLKKYSEEELNRRRQLWWDHLEDIHKQVIFQLPNFNPDIFQLVTGIHTGMV